MDMTHSFLAPVTTSPLCGYSERAYFPDPTTGKRDHCQHCADRDEMRRLERLRRDGARMIERRRNGRAFRA